MMTWLVLSSLLLAQAPAPDGGRPSDDVAAVKALYASAAYEEALSRASTGSATGDGVELAEYQALCLFALGRSDDADRAFSQIVLQRPTFTLSENDFSPKTVSFFHGVRKKVLPAAAKALYARAKGDYDGHRFSDAEAEFHVLVGVLDDPDLAGQEDAVADLRMLGDGFLKLASEAAAEAAKPVPPPAPVAPPPVAQPAPTPAPAAPTIYAASDHDVTPPVEIDRRLPEWKPTTLADRYATYRGVLELVIDEHGQVQSATMRQPVPAAYAEVLLAAAKTWHYKPAVRNGAPVSYRTFVPIVLEPKGN